MVETPQRRHSSRHRRVASILALRAIRTVSPERAADRRAERRRLARNRRYRARLAVLRDMRHFFGLPQPRRQRRPVQPPQVDSLPVVVVSSDTSQDDTDVEPPPEQLVIDLDSSLESLPNIDPRPEWQLPVEQLRDLGPLNITEQLLPPLQYQTLREAYVLLQQLQLPPLQPITPPPELSPRAPTPPPEQEEQWHALELEVARLDDNSYSVTLTQPLAIQQPQVVPVPEHIPAGHQQPPPMPAVDWALVAHALFTVAEAEHREGRGNPI